jgi:hypothetical protein
MSYVGVTSWAVFYFICYIGHIESASGCKTGTCGSAATGDLVLTSSLWLSSCAVPLCDRAHPPRSFASSVAEYSGLQFEVTDPLLVLSISLASS